MIIEAKGQKALLTRGVSEPIKAPSTRIRINLKTDKYLSVFKFIRVHALPFVNRFWCPHVNVKQCRDELNKMCKIEPLNAKFEGAKVTSVETVFKIHISDFLKQNSDFDPITDKIKINGDGARMTRNSNFILLSFSCYVIVFKLFSNLSG